MAKSQLLKRIKAQIMLDSKTESILVRNLTFKDSEVFEVLSDQEEFERVEFVKRAIKVGTIALRDVFVAEKVEYVKREFEKMCFEMDKVFKKELGKEGMKGELDKIFGDDGKLQICLEGLFGTGGKLSRDILDMNNKNSPIGKLRETIESYFVGKDSEIYSMLDPNAKDSPISRLRQEILEKLQTIEKTIEVYLAKKEEIEKAPKKGFIFEDDLEDALLILSKPFGDRVERTGTENGKLGNKKGDFIITINDPTTEGQSPKIVVEAKTNRSVRLTMKSLLGELREAIQNREANFAIAVTQTRISDSIGCYHEIEGNKIICTYDDNRLPLEVAYRIARAYVLMRNRRSLDTTIDVAKISAVITKIANDLRTIRGIRTNLNKIGRTADTISDDIKSLEMNIKLSLDELQDILRQKIKTK
jgi:hypothetical protein